MGRTFKETLALACLSATVGVAALSVATTAAAATVDLSPYVNANVRDYSSGGDYPVGALSITGVDGAIDFNIAPICCGGAGIIQLGEGNAVTGIAANQSGVDVAYVIVNSSFGAFGFNTGSLTFNGLAGAFVTFDLIEGVNIRDHFQNVFNNSASDIYGTASYSGGNRFDAYRYDISALGGTVTSIDFRSTPGSGAPNGAPFLAAVTLTGGAVPEPATWALMILGFGAAGAVLRRRRVALA